MATEMGGVDTPLDDAAEPRSRRAGTTTITSTREKDVDSASTLHDPSPQLSDELPIVYHYLTFDTRLPAAPLAQPREHNGLCPEPPPCPNLRAFDNPFTWSRPRKTFIMLICCATTVTAAYSAGSYEYAADQLMVEWGISNVVYNIGITIFTFGFGIAPMALAPFSEEYGRRPVMLATGLLYVGRQKTVLALRKIMLITTTSLPAMLCADPFLRGNACISFLPWRRRL